MHARRSTSNICTDSVKGDSRLRAHSRWLFTAAVAAAITLLPMVCAQAQAPTPSPSPVNPCPPELMPSQTLQAIPEIKTTGGKLRGTIIMSVEQQWMTFRVPVSAPSDSSRSQCQPQWVRTLRELGAVSKMGTAPYGPYAKIDPTTKKPFPYALPRPGPTLRARVGDLVQLTFLNQIDTGNFLFSADRIDRGETGIGGGCDQSNAGYPGSDKFPDCFHGSSTGNIHFHGTHTNPNTTGDNVFIEVRPSLRTGGKPIVTPESVAKPFQSFFSSCASELSTNVLKEWPRNWTKDMPPDWAATQKSLLMQYDTEMTAKYGKGFRKLWPVDNTQIQQGAWPQYHIGAFPYCYRIPEYTQTVWPPVRPPTTHPHMQGAGTAEIVANMNREPESDRLLMMGQAPGTHWYHAHKHGSTAINVANGITGAFIIEGPYDDHINNWYGDGWTQRQPVLVINQLGVSPNLMLGGAGNQDKGPDFSINGQMRPTINMQPGEVQMWRIVNTSGRAAILFQGPPKGFEWRQIAQDGVQFKDTNYQDKHFQNHSFLLAAGNRADLLVKAPDTPCQNPDDCKVMVKNNVDSTDLPKANSITLLSVNVAPTTVVLTPNQKKFMPVAPKFPLFLGNVTDDEIKGTKIMRFSSDGSQAFVQHMIDGKKFDGEVGAVVLLNQAEEWKVVNETYGGRIVSHPFHIHINPFQITEVFSPNDTLPDPTSPSKTIPKYIFDEKARKSPDQCYLDPTHPDTWNPNGANPLKPCATPSPQPNPIWWDVFPIPSGIKATDANGNPITKLNPKTQKNEQVLVPGYFKMRSRFVDYPGFYVLHCHILAHEDRGMMTIVEVAPLRTPYSHH